MARVAALSFFPFDVPLHEPFGIATGAQPQAENVAIRLTLDDQTVGLGEAAPVPHISGESRQDVLSALETIRPVVLGLDVSDYRRVCLCAREVLASVPSALAGLEIALFDALSRSWGVSLRSFFGGAQTDLPIDVTVTTGSVERAGTSAARYAQAGFELLKVKIGGATLDHDVARLEAIFQAAPGAQVILDGNTAFSVRDAVRLVGELQRFKSRIVLFEQPVARDDFEGLREVQHETGICVAADESLRTLADFRRIVRLGGIGAINIKTAKLGVLQAWDLLVAARSANLRVMVGGMVETEISMTASACLAAGVGGVEFADLDTPLLLAERPARGSIDPWGPSLDLSPIHQGHGVSWLGTPQTSIPEHDS